MERDKRTSENATILEQLDVNFESIPEWLRSYPHLVVWNFTTIVDDELKKPPFDPNTEKTQLSEYPPHGEVLKMHKQLITQEDNPQELE